MAGPRGADTSRGVAVELAGWIVHEPRCGGRVVRLAALDGWGAWGPRLGGPSGGRVPSGSRMCGLTGLPAHRAHLCGERGEVRQLAHPPRRPLGDPSFAHCLASSPIHTTRVGALGLSHWMGWPCSVSPVLASLEEVPRPVRPVARGSCPAAPEGPRGPSGSDAQLGGPVHHQRWELTGDPGGRAGS